MKIYLTGYYGQNNLGDDYIFYSILDLLGNIKQNVELNVEIGCDTFDNAVYEQIADKYENIKLKYTFIGGIQGKISKIFSLIKSDYWIVGGGGLFPTEDVSVLKHLNMYITVAGIFGTKVCFYGVDVDSLDVLEYREQWKKIVKSVNFIETRNEICAKQLENIVGNLGHVIAGVDLTHGFYTEEELNLGNQLTNKYDLEQPYMVWAVAIPWSKAELQKVEIKQRYDRLCGQFRNLLMRKGDIHHVFLPFFDGTDVDMINDILQGANVNYTVINQNCPIGEKRLFFKHAEAAVVMRFYGVQFALFHGTPFIAVSYSPKTTNILQELCLNELFAEYGIRGNSCFKKEFDISDEIWQKLESHLAAKMRKLRVHL